MEPLSVIWATILEAESAEVTRKTKISIIATTESTPEKGIRSNISNSATVILVWVAAARPTSPPSSMLSAAPPNTPIHRQASSGGTTSTPNTYSLMVRPRETRATKVPTKGDQAMTQAQ